MSNNPTPTNPQLFLHDLLTKSQLKGMELMSEGDLSSSIYKQLVSKTFRKTKVLEECEARTKRAISLRVDRSEPIKIIYPQGGYKLWRFPSSPEADWAEFFTISYLIEYVAPIAASYEPGVELVFYMHTLLMEKHDNLTTEEIDAYVDSFQRLLDEFHKHLPDNLKITILKDADLYSRKEYFQTLEAGMPKAENIYDAWSDTQKQEYLRMAELNIKWNGREDWEHLSAEEKKQKRRLAALYEIAATTQLDRVTEVVKAEDNVLVFTKATKDFIGIGSCRSSIAKYWVGYGVLETKPNGELRPRILTPSQFQNAKSLAKETIAVNVVPGKNFESIQVVEVPFSFST